MASADAKHSADDFADVNAGNQYGRVVGIIRNCFGSFRITQLDELCYG
jgi:hypothetical protein